MSVSKTVLRAGVITALVGGGAVVIAGPARIGALMHQTRDGINEVLDRQIDDPVALRAQIRQLEATYPKKIADVRADLGEVRGQVSELERELQVAVKVVDLASNDLSEIDDLLARAENARAGSPHSIVRVSMNGDAMDVSDAHARRSRISDTIELYTSRAHELDTDLDYLRDQENQLAELLTRLETERSEFQAKLFQLDAQIDAIARNDRMIEMMEDRQATIDEHSRYQAHSLDQLDKRLTGIRAEQRARLEAITGRESDRDYVNEAKFMLDRTGASSDVALPETSSLLIEPEVIEIGPDTDQGDKPAQKPVASRSRF